MLLVCTCLFHIAHSWALQLSCYCIIIDFCFTILCAYLCRFTTGPRGPLHSAALLLHDLQLRRSTGSCAS